MVTPVQNLVQTKHFKAKFKGMKVIKVAMVEGL